MKDRKNFTRKVVLFLCLLVGLFFLILAFRKAQQLLIKATGTTADIVIDFNLQQEPLKPVWKSFSQGGEESVDMIAPTVPVIKSLQPRYIRIDHIYDHFNLVSRNSQGQLIYNFSQLDQMVSSIRQTGALPFFSLSYMPQVIAENGDIVGKPKNWNEWSQVVKRTVEHYSSKSEMNLTNIYYEVWNEPDLFGNWKNYGDKNYLTLYLYSVQGAVAAQNTNSFKIGGPATTQLYNSWIKSFAEYVTKNNLRLDFFSWHRYDVDPAKFYHDVADVTSLLFHYPELVSLPRVVSEWGFDPAINNGYDGNFAAAHTVATIRQTLSGYDQMMAFEVVDGPSPENKTYWGRWGILTHPKFGLSKKPRYQAFELLNQLQGSRLYLKGEGTWVSGIAVFDKTNETLSTILVNFDPQSVHVEQTPLEIRNLPNGIYRVKKTRLGQTPTEQTVEISNHIYQTESILPINSIILIQLETIVNQNLRPPLL